MRGPAGAGGVSPDQEAANLTYANELLRRQVELASGQEFYLVLDSAQLTLRIMLQGVVLSQYEVQGIELGRPRALFRTQEEPEGWGERIWSDGQLSPKRWNERFEMIGPANDTTAAHAPPPIPPIAEEAIEVPARFRIQYLGGLSLEIRRVEPDTTSQVQSTFGRLAASIKDRLAVVFTSKYDVLRILVVLKPEDAGALYRALPPSTKFLVLRHPEW